MDTCTDRYIHAYVRTQIDIQEDRSVNRGNTDASKVPTKISSEEDLQSCFTMSTPKKDKARTGG